MEPIDTFEHAGLTVEIVPEEQIEDFYNPRGDSQLGHMACGHPNYNLGDEQLPRDGFEEIECPTCEGGERLVEGPPTLGDLPVDLSAGWNREDIELVCPRCEGYPHEVEPTIDEWFADRGAICAMPLFLLDHSGISIRTGKFAMLTNNHLSREDTASRNRFIGDEQGWDTSFIGFIYATVESITELCGTDEQYYEPAWLEQQLDEEVEEYDKYLTGDAGGFVIKDGDERLDSCWGFLGLWDDYVREAAKEAATGAREALDHEKSERESWEARDVMTVSA